MSLREEEARAGKRVLEKFVSDNPEAELEKKLLEMYERAIRGAYEEDRKCFFCAHWLRTTAPEQLIGNCTNEKMKERKDYLPRRSRNSCCSGFEAVA